MAHPLVLQLRFTRSELLRGLAGLTDPDAQRRLGPTNSISWMVGHLAWQEQRYWLTAAQRLLPYPDLNEQLAWGKPATTPPIEEMWAVWRAITAAADPWLDALTNATIQAPLRPDDSSVGTYLRRTTYHYWYHLGEAMAVRQLLGHKGLEDFVGDIDGQAPYIPE
jgi:hypothetical protein